MITSKNRSGPVVLVSQELKYTFPFSYAYLLGYLIERGEKPMLIFRPEDRKDYPAFARKLVALKPLVVGFGNLYPELRLLKALFAEMDKAGRDFPILIGGQMVTPTPEFALEITRADIGVIDEGEIILHNLVVALREGGDLSKVAGLVLREGDDIINTGPGPFIEDLSMLPTVPYHMFPAEKWVSFGRYYLQAPQAQWRFTDRCIPVHGSRGCPFHCNFCYHHGRTRYREIGTMIEEAASLLELYNGNMLIFTDDLTIGTPKRAAQLVEHVSRLKRKVSYRISCRFDILDRLDDGLLTDLKRSGCRIMAMGIESGSQKILNAMNKCITVEQIDRGLTRLKKVGILPSGNLMVGQIGETESDIALTKKFSEEKVRENKNLQLSYTIATPFPGSQLYDIAMARGLIKSHHDFFNRFDENGQMSVLSVNMSDMDDQTLLEKYNDLNRTYSKLRDEVVGKPVFHVENLIKRLNREDLKLKSQAPDKRWLNPDSKLYQACYHAAQGGLESIRLKLRGVK